MAEASEKLFATTFQPPPLMDWLLTQAFGIWIPYNNDLKQSEIE